MRMAADTTVRYQTMLFRILLIIGIGLAASTYAVSPAEQPPVVGKKDGTHLVKLRKSWYRLQTKADLADVRIHDLRYSFASLAILSGLPLQIIGKLMGHKKSATTERYAHLADDPLRLANEQIGQIMSGVKA